MHRHSATMRTERRLPNCLKTMHAACVAAALCAAAPTLAAPYSYTIDSGHSTLTAAVNVRALIFNIPGTPQGPGSLTTSLYGSLDADITATTIQLLSTSFAIANDSGSWTPGIDYNDPNYATKTYPANFGVEMDASQLGFGVITAAVRDLELQLSDAAPKTLSASGTFNEAGTTVTYTEGDAWFSSGINPPVVDLTGISPATLEATAQVASVDIVGSDEVITLPISVTTSTTDGTITVTIRYTGTIVAYRSLGEPDDDNDGVPNATDLCPATIPGVIVDLDGCPPYVPGDMNLDGDIDRFDLESFVDCLTSPNVPTGLAECIDARLDDDADADLADFAIFQACYSGEDVPADANCVAP